MQVCCLLFLIDAYWDFCRWRFVMVHNESSYLNWQGTMKIQESLIKQHGKIQRWFWFRLLLQDSSENCISCVVYLHLQCTIHWTTKNMYSLELQKTIMAITVQDFSLQVFLWLFQHSWFTSIFLQENPIQWFATRHIPDKRLDKRLDVGQEWVTSQKMGCFKAWC